MVDCPICFRYRKAGFCEDCGRTVTGQEVQIKLHSGNSTFTKGGNGIGKNKRQSVYERDGWRCLKCGRNKELTLDHITPKSHGGGNEIDNLQTLCYDCNQAKGATRKDYRNFNKCNYDREIHVQEA